MISECIFLCRYFACETYLVFIEKSSILQKLIIFFYKIIDKARKRVYNTYNTDRIYMIMCISILSR